ncbi:hypothetical protein BGX29_009782, partial [Mortierella sp. GBA35]
LLEEAETWAPALETLTAEEYERVLEDRERSIRRNRRATSSYVKRRGVSSYNSPGGYASKITKRGRNASSRHPAMDMAAYEDWQCQHCGLGAHSTVLLRAGPGGDKTLCNTCGLSWSVHGGVLPADRQGLFRIASAAGPASSSEGQDDVLKAESETRMSEDDNSNSNQNQENGVTNGVVDTPALASVAEAGA